MYNRHRFAIVENIYFSSVYRGKTSGIGHQIDVSTLDVNKMPAFYPQMPSINAKNEDDDVHANLNDHGEGLWENTPT